MTAVDLLNSLKTYLEDKVKDMRLIARVPENGTEAGERRPLVFIGNLPNKEQERKAAAMPKPCDGNRNKPVGRCGSREPLFVPKTDRNDCL